MKIEFELTEDDIVEISVFDKFNAPRLFPQTRKAAWRNLMPVFPILCLVCAALYVTSFLLSDPEESEPLREFALTMILILVIAPLLLWAIHALSPYKWRRYNVAKTVRANVKRDIYDKLGPVSIEVTSDALLTSSGTSETRWLWSGLKSVVQDKAAVYIYVTPWRIIVAPRRAFADEAQAQEFFEAVNGHIKAARG